MTRMCSKGLHPLEGHNAMPIKGTHKVRCRTCKAEQDKTSKFVARWPITDPTLSLDELVAQAESDLTDAPPAVVLGEKDWRIINGELVMVAHVGARKIRPDLRKDKCRNGHEYTDDNVIVYKDGRKRCRTCVKGVSQARRGTVWFDAKPLLRALDERGIDRSKVSHYAEWEARGRVSLAVADRVSVEVLKTHPAMVWGDDWWDKDAMEGSAA